MKSGSSNTKNTSTLPARAVSGHKEKILRRRRHQSGQLIRLENGFAMRYYETTTDGERVRCQKFLGSIEELPTARAAKNVMQAELVNVNKCVTVPSRSSLTFRVAAIAWLKECQARKKNPVKESVASG